VTVSSGKVMLTGTVEWEFQRKSAEHDVHKLAGVRSVDNAIRLAPKATPANVKATIEEALVRNAETDARAIRVIVDEGHHVRLEGKVRTWAERVAAERAAWSAPGVNSVEDRLAIDHI
jgi:osmotically-inducible protein OsmY